MAQVSSKVMPYGLMLDPVCGATLDAADAGAPVFFRGQSYHFCSHRCQTQFLANPPRDLVRAAARAFLRARVSLA